MVTVILRIEGNHLIGSRNTRKLTIMLMFYYCNACAGNGGGDDGGGGRDGTQRGGGYGTLLEDYEEQEYFL